MATASAVGPAPTTEIGYSGIQPPPWNAFGVGLQTDEPPELLWPRSIHIYNRMRYDPQISALLKAVTLPIRSWRWGIKPGKARDEVTAACAAAVNLPILGADDDDPQPSRFSYADHLRHSLLGLVFGAMFFEEVGHIDDVDLGWRLDKLAPRMPQSIAKIDVDPVGDLASITQFGGVGARRNGPISQGLPIPVTALAAYVWEREGANWLGQSMLRPLYKDWLLKDIALRIDAQKNERYGLGIPTGTAPKGASEAVITQYGKMAQSIKASPGGGVGLPNGASLGVDGIKGALPDILASVRYYDESMARNFLAMFMQLGQGEASGNRALGGVFVDFFDLGVQAVAKWHSATTDLDVLRRLVDWRFGDDEIAPTIGYEKSSDKALTAADLIGLVDADLIIVDADTEAWVRESFGVPERTGPPIVVQPITAPPSPPTPSPTSESEGVTATGRRRRHVHAVSSQTLDGTAIGHRQPTAVELKAGTDFEAMQTEWRDQTTTLVDAWGDIKAQQIDALEAAVTAAVTAASVEQLAALAAPVLGIDLLVARMTQMTEKAVTAAQAEAVAQGVTVPLIATSSYSAGIAAQAAALAGLLARTLGNSAAGQALQRYGVTNLSPADVAAGVRQHLEALSDGYLKDQLGGALTQAQNLGRAAVFAAAPPASYLASELLDEATCDPCAAADGTEYDSLDDALSDYPAGGFGDCDGGPRCRGTLVAVWSEGDATDTASALDVAASR